MSSQVICKVTSAKVCDAAVVLISIQITKKLYAINIKMMVRLNRRELNSKHLCAKPIAEEYNLSHALHEPDLSKTSLGGEAENVVVC